MKKEKSIARQEILNYIITFCTKSNYGDGYSHLPDVKNSFYSTSSDGVKNIPIGSLVRLMAAPFSKYYLSWLREVEYNDGDYSTKWLLESIEDGSLCWWENVQLWALPKTTTDEYPSWQWTDQQFQFKKRWFNACHKKRDAYILLPCFPEFKEDGSVMLSLRTRFSIKDDRPEIRFDNWQKVKTKEMLEFYDANKS